jgi:hypothetical protein
VHGTVHSRVPCENPERMRTQSHRSGPSQQTHSTLAHRKNEFALHAQRPQVSMFESADAKLISEVCVKMRWERYVSDSCKPAR